MIRLFPGMWRPDCAHETIAWVHHPRLGDACLWLDFEALRLADEILFLGHHSPRFPSRYPDLPATRWASDEDALSCCHVLPNGFSFAPRVAVQNQDVVALSLTVENHADEAMGPIGFQTCAYLRMLDALGRRTMDNKFVQHVDGDWLTYPEAVARPGTGGVFLGWQDKGVAHAGLPLLVACGEGVAIGFTWFDDTLNLVGNPNHPCFHADPGMDPLAPGEQRTLRGALFFGPTREAVESLYKVQLRSA